MPEWTDEKILGTSFITHSGPNGYQIHFETNRREAYEAVQEKIRGVMGHGKPKSNADRIRAMSDEELVKVIYRVCPSGFCTCWNLSAVNCEQCWLNWLKQEVRDD